MCKDFNKVMAHDEKWGDKRKANSLLIAFLTSKTHYEVANLGFKGLKFTWCNNRKGEVCISERLDHYLATIVWHERFLNKIVLGCILESVINMGRFGAFNGLCVV